MFYTNINSNKHIFIFNARSKSTYFKVKHMFMLLGNKYVLVWIKDFKKICHLKKRKGSPASFFFSSSDFYFVFVSLDLFL